MFTGIISGIGTIKQAKDLPEGRSFRVSSPYDMSTVDLGASIAHDGVCLTVTAKGEGWHEVEAWEEALRLTTAGSWAEGTRVNLERPLKLSDELGGHLVAGHVDGKAEVVGLAEEGDATRFTLRAPSPLHRFIARKGSVALNGTSLTINGVEGETFDVLLIRHSQEVTTWGTLKEGDRVNLEVDTMARYAARWAETA
ncbi:MAG: riboflavin synthase [Pseudomonadota bacterium]